MNNSKDKNQNFAPKAVASSSHSTSWILKLTIGLIGMFAFLQVYSIQAVLPVMMVDFSATEVQAGMIVGATVLAIAIMSPFLGMLSDAVGRKSFIVGALLFLAIPTALIAQSSSIEWVGIWRFMQGLSVPGITVVTIAYIGEEFEGRAMTDLMSFYVSGSVLGGFMGRFLMGHLHELIGWRDGYYVMTAMTLLGAIWVGNMLPSSRHFEANPNFRSAIQTLGELGTGALANIFAVYLLGVIITPLSTTLLRRFGSARTVRVAIIISMIGVLLTLVTPLWGVIIGLAVMSSGVFITQSATISYIAVNVKKGRSLASGLYYMGYYTGGTLGAWLGGIAYARGQWSLTVWLLLFVQVLALLIASFGMIKTTRRAT